MPNNKDKLEVIAVSLDDNEDDLDTFIKDNSLSDWINVGDMKKWQGEVVQAYDIFATPTMYLLYKDRTILAKPMTYIEVKDALYERNILR